MRLCGPFQRDIYILTFNDKGSYQTTYILWLFPYAHINIITHIQTLTYTNIHIRIKSYAAVIFLNGYVDDFSIIYSASLGFMIS